MAKQRDELDVPVTRLDSFLGDQAPFLLVKLDLQGGELAALEGLGI